MPSSSLSRRSRWPARLDLIQSLSGLFLALFMWLHMVFVSSILLGKDAMWLVSRMLEGAFVFGQPLPWIVSLLVAAIFALIVLHAALAMRKFPASWRQYCVFLQHRARMRHGDTTLWLVQVVTGFAMLFLASVHLYGMMMEPELIGPYGSADQVWSGRTWPLLLVLLLCVEVHGTVGLYRLAMKWGWPGSANPVRARALLRKLMWGAILLLIALGLASMAAYVKIGMEHESAVGERYVPEWARERP